MQNRKKITSRAEPNKPNKRRQPDNVLALKSRRKYEKKQAELIGQFLLTNTPRIKPAYMVDFVPSIPL